MTDAIETHRKTALDSPYSRDREEAIEELGRVCPEANHDERIRVLETLRQVAIESAHRQERELARETLIECFDADAEGIADIVVRCFAEVAQEARSSDERCSAIDTLRRLYPDVDEHNRERIGDTLADIAGNGTYEDERRRARQRLTDVAREERTRDPEPDKSDQTVQNAMGYLGQSLAERFATAAAETPEECRRLGEELRDFVANAPVDDEKYVEVRDELDALVEQLAVIPTERDLDDDRIERVERVATRVEDLYRRSG